MDCGVRQTSGLSRSCFRRGYSVRRRTSLFVRAQKTREYNRYQRQYPQPSQRDKENEWQRLKDENEQYYGGHDTWLDRYELSDEEQDRRAGRRPSEGEEYRRVQKRRLQTRGRGQGRDRGRGGRSYNYDDDDVQEINPFDDRGRWKPQNTRDYIASDKRLSRYEDNYNQEDQPQSYRKNYRTSRPPQNSSTQFRGNQQRFQNSRQNFRTYDDDDERSYNRTQQRGNQQRFQDSRQNFRKYDDEDDFDERSYNRSQYRGNQQRFQNSRQDQRKYNDNDEYDDRSYNRSQYRGNQRRFSDSRQNYSRYQEKEDNFDDKNYFDRNDLRYFNTPADIEHQKRVAQEQSEKHNQYVKQLELPMKDLDPESRQKKFHKLIVQRATVFDLQKLVQLYINDLNTTSLCIILVQISRLVQRCPQEIKTIKPAQKLFQWQLMPLCNEEELEAMPTPLLASCIWSMAKSQICFSNEGKKGLKIMLKIAAKKEDFSAENLALVIWAVGECGQNDLQEILTVFLKLSVQKIEFFESDALCSVLLATAKAGCFVKEIILKFLHQIENRLDEMTDREIASVIKAFETHRYFSQHHLDLYSKHIVKLHHSQNLQESEQSQQEDDQNQQQEDKKQNEEKQFKPRSAAIILQAWSQINYFNQECYDLLIQDLQDSSNAWALTTAFHAQAIMNRPTKELQQMLNKLVSVISTTGAIKKYWLKFLYSAVLIHKAYGGSLEVPLKLRQEGKKARIQEVKLESKTKNMVADKAHGVLRRMHLIGKRNVFVGNGEVRVELQIQGFQGKPRVAIQFCSKNSYVVNMKSMELARSRAYRNLLEVNGYKVIVVRNADFVKLPEKQKRQFLQEKFDELNLVVEGQKYMDELEAKRQSQKQSQSDSKSKTKKSSSNKKTSTENETIEKTEVGMYNTNDEKESFSQFESENQDLLNIDTENTDIDSRGVDEQGPENDEEIIIDDISETSSENKNDEEIIIDNISETSSEIKTGKKIVKNGTNSIKVENVQIGNNDNDTDKQKTQQESVMFTVHTKTPSQGENLQINNQNQSSDETETVPKQESSQLG